MRNGFWTGMATGALLGALLVLVLSPEARSQVAELAGDVNMGGVGRRLGRAARNLADRTGVDEAMEAMS